MVDFAQRLKEAMEMRNIKQAQLAQKCNIGKSSISTYLKGKYLPKYDSIVKLADALNVSPKWLAGEDDSIVDTNITDDQLKFALFNAKEGVTDQMLEEVKSFADYILKKNSPSP
ncbi:MAG: helix-turn-helix transcriptional regulator [Clostridiales bacterium]|nr:helix-turn-helix transcriptional regulator [Clostridiales bacterium]